MCADRARPWLDNYPEGVRPSLEYPEVPLFGLLDSAAERHPDAPATIFFGGRTSYAELRRRVDAFAAQLQALGVRKGDRVAVMLPNCPQQVIAYYGILKAGGVVVEINPMYVEREIAALLADSGAGIIVVLDLLFGRVRAARGSTAVKNVIVTGIQDYLPFPLNLLYPIKAKREGHSVVIPREPGILSFKALVSRGGKPSPVKIDPRDDTAILQYTGGTTGTPKGAVLTHCNLVANTLQSRECYVKYAEGKEKILTVLPLFHVYGMTVCMNLAVSIAGAMILLPRFGVADVVKTIQKQKPTMFPGAPAMYIAVNNYPDVKKYDLSSINACISGSAALPVEVLQKFESLTGGKLREGYGLTEASPVTHSNPIYGRYKPGSIGVPVPDTDCRIMDMETGGREMPVGEAGELAIHGPQVMKGYWNRPGESAAVLRDGWLYTGDVARMDEEGYFYIVERKKDIIIAGGFNIYPREVEEVLFEHPKVLEAAVAGVPDRYRGETVKAYVVLKPGESATAEEIISFCRERMAKFKAPTAVEFRAELPKTMVGKVLRRVLVEEEARRAKEAAGG